MQHQTEFLHLLVYILLPLQALRLVGKCPSAGVRKGRGISTRAHYKMTILPNREINCRSQITCPTTTFSVRLKFHQAYPSNTPKP